MINDFEFKKTVTIGVVALNEEQYLKQLFDDFKAQTYPHKYIDIILVDSGSADTTLQIMENLRSNNDFNKVLILKNKKKIQSAGWNIIINNVETFALSRIDAHAKLPNDFIYKNMENIKNGENISGGIRPNLIINENNWTKTLLEAENSMFGSSINISRRSEKKQYVKTMFHATYRMSIFKKVGLFNETLGRTEDNELHYRMRREGYKFLFDPEIVSYQYARSSLKKMLYQKYSNGYWIGLTLCVCPQCLSSFYFVPFAFSISVIASVILLLFTNIPFVILFSCYFLVACLMTLFTIKQNGFRASSLLLPLLFFLLHFSYGIGTIVGIASIPIKKETLCMNEKKYEGVLK